MNWVDSVGVGGEDAGDVRGEPADDCALVVSKEDLTPQGAQCGPIDSEDFPAERR